MFFSQKIRGNSSNSSISLESNAILDHPIELSTLKSAHRPPSPISSKGSRPTNPLITIASKKGVKANRIRCSDAQKRDWIKKFSATPCDFRAVSWHAGGIVRVWCHALKWS